MTTRAVSPGTLTGATEDELGSWLRQLREVGARAGEDALAATDVLLWSIGEWLAHRGETEDQDWHHSLQADRQAKLSGAIEHLRGQLAHPEALKGWEASQLRQQVSLLADLDAPALRAEALGVADRADIVFCGHTLMRYAAEPLTSAAGLPKRLGLLEMAVLGLRHLGALTPALEDAARQAKTLAARYRADKKRDEAAVVEAGGNQVKAHRLRKEAAVLLAQDWARVFPGDPAPPS